MTSTPLEPIPPYPEQEQLLQQIFEHLRRCTGHDFSNYKRPTLLRRIQRRIQFNNLPGLEAYVNLLQQKPEEVNTLLQNLLISVTHFFRDSSSFQELEQTVIPMLFTPKKPGEPVRIWVAGCATGEEAYSIAMICAEHALQNENAPGFEIIATDIDDQALQYAKAGCYNAEVVENVSPNRLQQFFAKQETGYQVQPQLREKIRFVNQNFLHTVPATNFHLISCRNVFIYLNYAAQQQVLHHFKEALRPGGFLFLGKAESINGAPHFFTPLSREHQVYQQCQR